MINGDGTLTIKNFQASNYGKLVCSCGECGTQCQRNIVVHGQIQRPNIALVGINENYGEDKATIKNVQGLGSGANVCTEFTGVTSGTTSKLRDYKVDSAGDGKNCIISNIRG